MFFRFEGFIRWYHHETTWSCQGVHDAWHQHFWHSHKGELLPFEPSSNTHIGGVTLSLLSPCCCLRDTSREWRSDMGDWLYGPSHWGALGLIGCTFEPSLTTRHRALVHQNLHICWLLSHMSCSMDISYTWQICILCMDWLTSWLPCCILYSHVIHDIWACALS